MADAFSDGAGQHVVAPGASSSFLIWSKVRSNHAAWQIGVRKLLARAFHPRRNRLIWLRPVMWRVAVQASHAASQIFSTLQPRWRAFESTRCQRARSRPQKRTQPEHLDRAGRGQGDNKQNHNQNDLHPTFHENPPKRDRLYGFQKQKSRTFYSFTLA